PKSGPAAFEKAGEDVAEVPVHFREGLLEALLPGARLSPQRLLEVLDRAGEVVVLSAEKAQPLFQLAVFLVGHEVDGAHRLELLHELVVTGAQLGSLAGGVMG